MQEQRVLVKFSHGNQKIFLFFKANSVTMIPLRWGSVDQAVLKASSTTLVKHASIVIAVLVK